MFHTSIIQIFPLGFTWETKDPFLFCVHHLDHYPAGNNEMGPAASLAGRNLGNDFTIKDGWRMYHGQRVPGFPSHPHRGFETVTAVQWGFVDHSDSHGAAGRYGNGDVQWMTAGEGLQHAEMFPLLNKDKENPLELFQIWLNSPADKKMVEPHYKMLWAESIPKYTATDENGKKTEIELIAGQLENLQAPAPAPNSWAADTGNEVAIWIIRMEAGAKWKLPPSMQPVNRAIYFYEGKSLNVAGKDVQSYHAVELYSNQSVLLENGDERSNILMLQGRPINEPVAQYGPFVMNTREEIQKAMNDFRNTQFGGWPWPRNDQVHDRNRGRFALHTDGREEIK